MVGVKVGGLSEKQQELVLEAVAAWVDIQESDAAEAAMKRIKAELDDVHFTWVGEYGVNKPCYYRIQGPSFVVELLSMVANVGPNKEAKGHYHTVFREFRRDYGSN